METVDKYQQQLNDKAQRITEQFAGFDMPSLELFTSKPEHYRMRAEFRVWHDGEALDYIMFDQATKQKYTVEQFPTASVLINRAMPLLLEQLKPDPVLRRKLFQVDFLSTQSGELLISLLYHRQLDDSWQAKAREMRSALREQLGAEVDLIGRARKQKVVLEREYVIEKLQVNNRELTYQQVENSFTQPNAEVNQKMLGWALDVTANSQGDLLELYCGNGNFSLALAQNFDRVLATEIAKSSVNSAQFNLAKNNIDNVTIVRMSSEEFTEAMAGVRAFRRLEGIDLQSFNCQTILVDPPRAGLDDGTRDLVQNYERIVYISCNPDTLCRDLDQLCETHRIERFALFDQFPWTHHVESGVYLVRR